MDEKNKIEYVKTITGKKVVKIPVEELQFLELQFEFLPKKDVNFSRSESERLMKVLGEKYGMFWWEVQDQSRTTRRKSVWKVIKFPLKEQLELSAQIRQLFTKDVEIFRSEYDKLLKETAEKYGLISKT